jgi:hypothetical protein
MINGDSNTKKKKPQIWWALLVKYWVYQTSAIFGKIKTSCVVIGV